ncbi:MAG TPA: hypothetical protein VFT95_01150 [Micromonosporaceae bacterium]|nr:hypothetical protein [Micromonosporaceae bacterium]
MEFMHPLAYVFAGESGRRLAHSALPDAPVVPEPVRAVRAPRARRRVALTLHRLADRVQPA